jgi:hypothetical protein
VGGVWKESNTREIPDPAHRRRIALAVAGVQRVLPLWKQRYGQNDIPQVALSTVEAIVGGKRVDAQNVLDKLWGDVVHLSVEEPFPEVAVGFAAVQAISTAMQDELFAPSNLDPGREDGDDPESWDSAFYASVAAAGGLPSDPQSNADIDWNSGRGGWVTGSKPRWRRRRNRLFNNRRRSRSTT